LKIPNKNIKIDTVKRKLSDEQDCQMMWQIENDMNSNSILPQTNAGEELVDLNLTDQAKSLSPMLPPR